MNQDFKFMNLALKLAKKAYESQEVPIGAVVVDCNGNVIGEGYNQTEKNNQPTHHAEILAIGQACSKTKSWRLDGATIYTTLEPCIMCYGAILEARIEKVVFGAKNIKKTSMCDVIHLNKEKLQVIKGVEEGPCQKLLKLFFEKLRKKNE